MYPVSIINLHCGQHSLGGGINPLSPNIYKEILQTDLYTFPYRISWEKLIKDQRFFSL